MGHLATLLFGSDGIFQSFGMWAFLSIGAVALFAVFIPLVHYIDSQRKEREAFYRAETIRRVAEASPDGAKATMELLREQERIKLIKTREGMKIGGVINIGVGIGLVIFLHALLGGGGGSVNNGGTGSVYLCGLIPGFIGVAMLVYVYFLASVEDDRKR